MVKLKELTHVASSDRGNVVNIGVIALEPEYYDVIDDQVTPERVAEHFESVVDGPVEKYTLPNIDGFNFVLYNALGGGNTQTLRFDAQGKTYRNALLRMEIDYELDE